MKNNPQSKKRRKYWLIKSEAECYSIDDLKRDRVTAWSGVRNFQARNFMRDDMKVGDMALFYHSSTSPTGIVGVARVKSEPYADLTAFDPRHEHFDPRSALLQKKYIAEHVARTTRKVTDAAHSSFVPTWMLVDFSFVKKFSQIITLAEIKSDPKLDGMVVRQKGSRLSIQPVSEKEFCYITEVMARKR